MTLGRFSMDRYFPGQSISRIHGRPKRVGEVFYLPMFHPAAALRNAEWRAEMAKDIKRIPEMLLELETAKAPKAPPPDPKDQGVKPTQLSLF